MIINFLVEIQQMLDNDGISLRDVPEGKFSEPWKDSQNSSSEQIIIGHEGSGSGGYADHIFKYAAKELFGDELTKLEYKILR